jgi:transcriptional regulator GlxA family with amidase domain
MSPEVAREVWAWLGPRADEVRADPYLGVVFSALEVGDERALHAGLAAKHLAKCDRATLGRHCRLVLGQGLARAVMEFRLESARRLLAAEPVTVAAAATGFGDVTVLRHAYRRRFGCPPTTPGRVPTEDGR